MEEPNLDGAKARNVNGGGRRANFDICAQTSGAKKAAFKIRKFSVWNKGVWRTRPLYFFAFVLSYYRSSLKITRKAASEPNVSLFFEAVARDGAGKKMASWNQRWNGNRLKFD